MNILTSNIVYKAEKCRQIILNHLYEDYFKSSEFAKIVRDEYYHWVYYSGTKTNGYVSNDVFLNKATSKKSSTKDHYLSPRIVISSIIENNVHILHDKDSFCEVFNLCRDVVGVTREQNDGVRFINKNNRKIVNELTINKYDKYGPWWQVDSRKKVLGRSDEFPFKNKIPEWFTEYEKKLLINH